MEKGNDTTFTEFILIGYSGKPKTRMGLIFFLTLVYSITAIGNVIIVLVTIIDSRLHNPMYFFLSNLSFLDICLASSSIPQSIANLLVDKPAMSYALCYFQMSSGMYLGMTECFLLAIMAYDRFIAISSPLHYMLIMNKRFCIQLAAGMWSIGIFFGFIPINAMPVRYCGNNVVDFLTCELKAIMKLVCSDNSLSELMLMLIGSVTLLGPFAFIVFSYIRIIVAIMRMHSAGGRLKAFSTCSSHLIVITIFFGSSMFSYLLPQSKSTKESDKIISVFYGILTPMLNPLIYTLRNQEVIGALKRLVAKKKVHE